jgi:RNA polymerase sigma-70 factor (ECF subfamily)
MHPAPLLLFDLDTELARLHPAAFGWALTCCKWDRRAAEDVLQIAYLKILDGRARFAHRSNFRTFLFSVIRRTAAEELRRQIVRRVLSLADIREPAVGAEGLDSILREESSRRLESALKQLSARQRQLLHLVFYQDLTIAEAAVVVGISIGSARTHYERGKEQLRRLLGEA